MPPKTVTVGNEIGEKLRNRREMLRMTIEDAAKKANVSPKTWSRYESGGSIRKDKLYNVCIAMKWPLSELNEETQPEDLIDELFVPLILQNPLPKKAPAIRATYGKYAETAFLVGSDVLIDELNYAISELAQLPRGTHIGTLYIQTLFDHLPKQFITRYDYEFLYAMRAKLLVLRKSASDISNKNFRAHTVVEEILLYMSASIANEMFEEFGVEHFMREENDDQILQHAEDLDNDSDEEYDDLEADTIDWVFELLGDADIITLLYTPEITVQKTDSYHFDNWFVNQFYIKNHVQENMNVSVESEI